MSRFQSRIYIVNQENESKILNNFKWVQLQLTLDNSKSKEEQGDY